ncbi:Uncharacterised protein [Legionella steigerwaltii]|uniref:Uncharacterized protein n=1 Tax=Legionella steigerwaltii TaxID=460 RepID=A0A378L9I9_9GAMM|nr:hypothetical protein [Legionella steigerwaltii]KTD80297.1 hypothetical protein Lstg_0559 [Legionella steigerwaltii]STY22379.1 Uncharacterised protein [Legionella steigerwaltii]
MQYKITEQFARGEEKVIAEFNEFSDTKLFITKKIANSDQEKQKIIYRLYDDSDLLHELNKENISVAYAKYAEGNGDLNLIQLPFLLMSKQENLQAKREIARFAEQNDANLFMMTKCETDTTTQDNDLFFLFKNQSLIDTLNRVINSHRQKEAVRFTGNEKGATFHPTPLPNRPTPPGGPSDCWIENDEDK